MVTDEQWQLVIFGLLVFAVLAGAVVVAGAYIFA